MRHSFWIYVAHLLISVGASKALPSCNPNPCLHGAPCESSSTGVNQCKCDVNHIGDYCQFSNPCHVNGNSVCLNNGTCHVVNGSSGALEAECVCSPGYDGSQCEYINPLSVCKNHPCQNGGTCVNTDINDLSVYHCVCKVGYHGKHCENVDHCISQPCSNGATCTSHPTGPKCTCLFGFTGPTCKTDIDECAANPNLCQNGGSCQNQYGTFICNCHAGYRGTLCELPYVPCYRPDPCQNNGMCKVTGPTSYQCICPSDPKISLNEILLRDGEMVISDMLYLKILSTKEPVTYTNKTGVATMKEIVIADSTAYSKAISYDAKNFPLLVNDECIIITNFIKKPDRSIIITSQTNVFSTSTSLVTIPEEIRKEAQEKKITTVLDASMSPQKTVLTVQGKIVKAAPSCKKRLSMTSEEVSFKRIKLKDESGTVEVGLWREMAESQVKEGDYVALNNFYVTSRYHKEKRSQIPILASQKKNSSVQFLPNSDDNLSDDASDFEEEKNQKKEGVLIGLQSIHIYPSCINTRCNFKKLGDKLQCTNCKITYSQASAGKGFVVKVLIQEEGFKVYTIFTEAMNGLLKSVNLTDSTDIMQDMKQIMPLKVSFHAESDKLKFIVASSC